MPPLPCPYTYTPPPLSAPPLSPSQPVPGMADWLSAGLSQQMAAVWRAALRGRSGSDLRGAHPSTSPPPPLFLGGWGVTPVHNTYRETCHAETARAGWVTEVEAQHLLGADAPSAPPPNHKLFTESSPGFNLTLITSTRARVKIREEESVITIIERQA